MCEKDDMIEKIEDNKDCRELCLEDIKKHIVYYAIRDFGLFFTAPHEITFLEHDNEYFSLYTNDDYEYIDVLGLDEKEQEQIESFYQAIQENKKFIVATLLKIFYTYLLVLYYFHYNLVFV